MPHPPSVLTRLCRALLIAALVANCLASASSARAQAEASAVEESASYREAVEEAVREFEAQHYSEARALFVRAHDLYPNARTERGLGFTEFELRHYHESIRHLEAALSSRTKPLSEELRHETELLLARARGFVGRVYVEAEPASAAIVVDGLSVPAAAGDALTLDAGDHVLEVRAPGYATERRKLSVQGGEEQRIRLVLSAQVGRDEPPKQERSWYRNPWLWAGIGVVVAGAVATTGVVLTRSDAAPKAYGGSADGVLSGP